MMQETAVCGCTHSCLNQMITARLFRFQALVETSKSASSSRHSCQPSDKQH